MSTIDLAIDPVCGMRIDPARAAGKREHQQLVYHLCSVGCLLKFDADADAYVAASRAEEFRTWEAKILTHVNSAPDAAPPPA